MTSKLYPSLFIDKFTALDRLISAMRKPCVNQVWACANQNQPCVNFFSSYANPEISAIPKYFFMPCWFGAYYDVLIMGHTFRVQSGKVTFLGQKKFAQFTQVYTGLPPDVDRELFECARWRSFLAIFQRKLILLCESSFVSTQSRMMLYLSDVSMPIEAPMWIFGRNPQHGGRRLDAARSVRQAQCKQSRR